MTLRGGRAALRASRRDLSADRARGCEAGQPGGDGSRRCAEVAIKVESVAAFSRAHDLGLEIVGYPMGPYRVARIPGERTTLAVVERRGYLGFEPFPGELAREGRMKPHAARDALAARDLWQAAGGGSTTTKRDRRDRGDCSSA